MKSFLRHTLPLLTVICACADARAEVRYQVRDLGNLGSRAADATGINEIGHAVGQGSPTSPQRKPLFWSPDSGIVDFLPAGNPGTFPTGSAFGLNDLDQVVGYISPDQDQAPRAFVWSQTMGFQQLGTLGGPDSHATAINNAGQIVGNSGIPSGLAHAFVYDPINGMRDIAGFGGNSYALALNEQGQAAGRVGMPSGQDHAFRWTPEAGMVDLGTLGGVLSEAYGINNLGHVVGHATTAEAGGNHVVHAFLYDETGMHDIGHLGGDVSYALAINDSDQVVGYSYIVGETTVRGFLWENGTMLDLNTLIDPATGWRISKPRDINNTGQIVALALKSDEPWAHAVLLTPVPEPCIVAFVASSVLLLQRPTRRQF